MKPVTSVINTGENIVYPEIAARVDYEGEMALVIKDKIKDAILDGKIPNSREEALKLMQKLGKEMGLNPIEES